VTRTAGSPAPPRWLLGAALALPVALVVAVLIAAAVLRGQRPEPLRLADVPAPAAGSADCARLLSALPAELDGPAQGVLERRQLAAPASAGTAAWGTPPVVLRCGIDRPAELTITSRLLDVSGVQFLEVPAPAVDEDAAGEGAASWVAVDRPVYVALTLPAGTGSGPVQQVAEQLADTLPQRELELPY
jgi:hypothetical protein